MSKASKAELHPAETLLSGRLDEEARDKRGKKENISIVSINYNLKSPVFCWHFYTV